MRQTTHELENPFDGRTVHKVITQLSIATTHLICTFSHIPREYGVSTHRWDPPLRAANQSRVRVRHSLSECRPRCQPGRLRSTIPIRQGLPCSTTTITPQHDGAIYRGTRSTYHLPPYTSVGNDADRALDFPLVHATLPHLAAHPALHVDRRTVCVAWDETWCVFDDAQG